MSADPMPDGLLERIIDRVKAEYSRSDHVAAHETRTASVTAPDGEDGVQQVCKGCDWTGEARGWHAIDARHLAAEEGAAHSRSMLALAHREWLDEQGATP